MATIYLPSIAEVIPFEELSKLIAVALYPDENQISERTNAACQYDRDTVKSAYDGTLTIRNPLTRAVLPPATFTSNQLLVHGVVTPDDLRQYLKGRNIDVVVASSQHNTNESTPPSIRNHLLNLAEIHFKSNPGILLMLKRKLTTRSPTTRKIFECLEPGEWNDAMASRCDLSRINAKLLVALDVWVASKPTSKSNPKLNVTSPATHTPVGPAGVKTRASKWHLHKPLRDDGLALVVYDALKWYHDSGKAKPTGGQLLADFKKENEPGILSITDKSVKYAPTGTGDGTADARSLSDRIRKMTTPKTPK